MNDTQENQPPEQPPTVPPHQDSAKFFTWLRSLGVQRGRSRWVGGVCSGLAEKWGIDPVIVRGLAVVLTLFFGIGLLAYGLAWALLPEPDGRIHVEQVARGHWSTGMTGAAVATFGGLAGPGQGIAWNDHGSWFPWTLFWTACVVGLIVRAVNRDKSKDSKNSHTTQGPVSEQPAAATPAWNAGAWTAGAWTERQLGPEGPLGPNGPLGQSGPLGHNGPLATKRRPRLGAPATLLSLGLAVMVGALVLILNASGVLDLHGYQVATAAAAAAVTAGLAIMVSGLRGRTAGGLGTFAVIALVVAGLLSLVPTTGVWSPLANQSWAPTSVAAAQGGFSVIMGNATLDLTGIDAGKPLAADVQVPVELAAAQVVIKVPTSVPVTIKSDLAAAALHIQGQPDNGGNAVAQSGTTRMNPAATGHGLVVTLDGAAGNVTIIPVDGK